jgi:hypothetical protein
MCTCHCNWNRVLWTYLTARAKPRACRLNNHACIAPLFRKSDIPFTGFLFLSFHSLHMQASGILPSQGALSSKGWQRLWLIRRSLSRAPHHFFGCLAWCFYGVRVGGAQVGEAPGGAMQCRFLSLLLLWSVRSVFSWAPWLGCGIWGRGGFSPPSCHLASSLPSRWRRLFLCSTCRRHRRTS